jgi:hypothetical protein
MESTLEANVLLQRRGFLRVGLHAFDTSYGLPQDESI